MSRQLHYFILISLEVKVNNWGPQNLLKEMFQLTSTVQEKNKLNSKFSKDTPPPPLPS